MTSARHRLAFAVFGFALAACGKPPDPVATDVEATRDRTVPPGARIVTFYPLRRDDHSARASWEIETEMSWSDYTARVEQRLGEYRLAEKGRDRLRLSRQMDGDVYVLVLVAKPDSKSLRIEASFEARPF